uniref:Uncharacterized protein n=1 Tax=Rhizophora mucronata TaxID=61149 RepID=A0A2P2P9X6_RHIMU
MLYLKSLWLICYYFLICEANTCINVCCGA